MENFVGVMDSGVGGLTVLRELACVAPQCNFVYVADHAFCPYGTKTFEEIKSRVVDVARHLANSGASGIVVACNTASVFAREIAESTALPVFDVITPTCKSAAQMSKSKRIAVLATDATVKSKVYQNTLLQQGMEVVALPCSSFVPLVEQCAPETEISKTVSATLCNVSCANCDVVILGCTHFPFLQKHIQKHVGNAQILSCAIPVAESFSENCLCKLGSGKRTFFTTGAPVAASRAARPFGDIEFAHIDIV